jgi:Xaa-Pro aminopeptidase
MRPIKTMKEVSIRNKKVQELKKKADKLLFYSGETPSPNFTYFTNSDVAGFLVHDFNKPKLITNKMEYTRAKKSWSSVEEGMDNVASKLKGKRIGIDLKHFPASLLSAFRKSKIIDISHDMENIRATKTKYEIKQIQKACSLSKNVWKYTEKQVSTSLTEKELKAIMEKKMLSLGVERSFRTIVASGTNSKYPHHISSDTRIKLPVVIDFGVLVNGYCSDVTRTVGSEYEKKLEDILEELYEYMEVGMKARDADSFVRKKLGSDSKFFIHSLGHGIGLEVHESPVLGQKSNHSIETNMMFTIEPGIYRKRGIRIENDFLMIDGLKNLTKF